jgi:hypothetical protein
MTQQRGQALAQRKDPAAQIEYRPGVDQRQKSAVALVLE